MGAAGRTRPWDRGRPARQDQSGRDARGPRGWGRGRRGARRDARYGCDEPVAAPRHGRDDGLPAVADGLTNLADAMRQRLVGHDHVRPDRPYQFLFGDNTVSVFDEVAQDLEGLRTQLNVAICSPQGAAREIQRISLELKHLEAAPRSSLPWLASERSGQIETLLSESWPGLSRPSTSCLLSCRKKDVDARDKRGHDGGGVNRSYRNALQR